MRKLTITFLFLRYFYYFLHMGAYNLSWIEFDVGLPFNSNPLSGELSYPLRLTDRIIG